MNEMDEFGFHIELIHTIDNPFEDYVDAHIHLDDGRVFYASFFTINAVVKNLHEWHKEKILTYWKHEGECPDNAYFWSVDTIIVYELDIQLFNIIIKNMLEYGYFFKAFSDITEFVQECCPCPRDLSSAPKLETRGKS